MKSQLITVTGAALLWLTQPALTQSSYPQRPVQFVVSYTAGGATDLITRIMSERFQVALKQPFPVENRAGAGGNIGAAYVANSAPDGHTIFMASPGPLITNPFLYPKLPYDPFTAFAPVILVARLPNVLVVHPSLGVKSIQQLIDKAKQAPGAINFASGGAGSSGHLSMELLKAKAGIDLAHVPYKGTGQAQQDVLAGRVPVIFDNVAPLLPYINSGALLALGVSTPNRIASLPDIPAVAETVPGFEASSWVAIVAPAKTEAGIINRLSATANQILLDPVVKDRLATLGATPAGGSSAELGTFLGEEKAKWRDVISQAGLMVGAK